MLRNLRLLLCILLLLLLPGLAQSATTRTTLPAGVRTFSPTGTVPDNVSFRAVFTNPVVTKAQTGKSITPDNQLFPFQVNPPLQLEGRWQNERTFTAKLLSPLRNATTYTATLREGLKDRRGTSIGPGEFRFQTEGLSPSDIRASMGRDGNAYFTLTFNMRVDPARLKGFMRIINPEGREVPYNINGALPSRTIRASIPVNKTSSRQRYTVRISAGLKSGEGNLGIDRDISESVILDPALIVQDMRAESENTIRATLNFPVDPETVKNFVNIEPPVSNPRFESGWNDEILTIRTDDFKPRSRFVLTFRKGFPSKTGLVLTEDFSQAIIMPDLASEINLPGEGTYLSPVNNGLIPIELLNVKKLQLDLWRMYDSNIPYVMNEYEYFDKDIARRVFTKEIPLDLPLNQRVRRSIPVGEMASADRGLFLLTARDADGEEWDETRQMINLSDMGAVVRLWEDGVLVWVNTLTTAKSVAGASVKIYTKSKQLLCQGETNQGGVYYYELPDGKSWDNDSLPDIAIITKGKELTYVHLTRNLLSREIFDTSGRDWLGSGYDGMIFSPRDIYRTGESAVFKLIVRNADNSTPESFPLMFVVRDSLGRRVKQESLTLNAKGSAIANLSLPGNALTGTWTASAYVPGNEGEKPIASYRFHVEDFAPPRIEVKLNTYRQYLIHGDTFTADIYARWLFGADGAGLKYRTSWSAREGVFTPTQDRWKEYTFGDASRKFASQNGEIDEAELDSFGAAKASLKLTDYWEAPTVIDVTLRTEVMEDSGRWSSASITRPYYPAPWLLGIAPLTDSFSVRNNAVFRVAAITPAEEPANPGELHAELVKVTWNYNIVEIDGRKRWQSTEEHQTVSEKAITLRNGMGEVSFIPETYGTYMVSVSDSDGNAKAVYRFYASDSSSSSSVRLIDRIDITPDKASYRLGDTAHVKIAAPFEGSMLITVEGAGLMKREVRLADASELTIDIPVTQNMRPNVWVSAWLVRPVEESDANQWASHRAIGLARIMADVSDYNIDIGISAAKKAAPSTKLPVTITLKGSSAMISQNADVSIALVDDGVLGLTRYKVPDLLGHFWGRRKLNSQGYDIYDQLIPTEDRMTPALHPGGDEGADALALDGNVSRFKILSLFDGVIYPDERGMIQTEFELPEFSGRGRLFVVAASGKSFGHAETTVEIARDIVTETGLPRFAAPGDKFTIPVTVFNTSNQPQNVRVSLEPEGLMLDNTYSDLRIDAGAKSGFTVQASALGGGDKAALRVVTSWGSESFTQEIEMPVRAAWPVVTVGASGTFESGNTQLDIPVNDFDGEIRGELTLSDTPAVNINKAVAFLNTYPYGCLEQTISGAWPFLILPDAVAELDPGVIADSQLHERTESAITRIQSMQLYNGSFAMWPGTNQPYNWGSVYAAHFLLSAKHAGVNFPEEMLSGVMNWLREFLASMPEYSYDGEESDDLTTKAYAVYVLALNGEKPLGWLEYLRENEKGMRQSGHIYLAGARAIVDGKPDALRALNLGKASGYSGTTLESDARNTAMLLTMWLDVDPQAPEVTELAMRLAGLRWYSTQDNAMAITALARYNVEASGAKSDITAHVNTDTSDKPILSYQSGKGASSVKISELPKSEKVQIESSGSGQGCYSWSITGTPKSQPKPERRNINIECLYYDEAGNAVDFSQPVTHGKIIEVVLGVKPSMTVNNLAVSYLLPAGFELENPRIDDGHGDEETHTGVVSDIRDDRIVLFFGRLEGERSYGFKMRAVTRGTFRVPQVSAMGMYDAGIRFTGSVQPDVTIR